MNSPDSVPTAGSVAFVPALITLGVTLIRLSLELVGAPRWLASGSVGGSAALFGIVWLPLIFGPYFAIRIRPYFAGGKAFWLRLWKVLTVYGLMARVPVFLLTIGAVLGEWGTHYEKFPNETRPGVRIAMGFVAQVGFWACVWTPVVGLVATTIVSAVRAPSRAPQAQARS